MTGNTFAVPDMKTYNVNEAPFALYGLCREPGECDFKRLPHWLPPTTGNEIIPKLYTNTAGIRLRFKTDSMRIVLHCRLPELCKVMTMPVSGSAGFDMYADGRYCSVFHPGIDRNGCHTEPENYEYGYSSGYNFPDRKLRDIVINFPTYNPVSEVYISLEEDACLLPGEAYRHKKPVLFYGSSITQGGCSSHPGNHYPAMISRMLDVDIINLGFSGGCRAEPEMAEYIAGLDMSVFVFDYDHNAQSVEHLSQTHHRFYQQIRARNPQLPIVMISAADQCFADYLQRREVIVQSYQQAVASGDKNVYFVDGVQIYKDLGLDVCLVDFAHPNDLGFYCMANAIAPVIAPLLA